MPNDDTIKLLKECNAGVKMGISGIERVIEYAQDDKLKNILQDTLTKHKAIEEATHSKLNDYHDTEKDPNAMAEMMSSLKINFKMMTPTDEEIADLMIDGCNMGIKSVSRYLNQYPTALPEIREMTERLVKLEQDLMNDLRPYL